MSPPRRARACPFARCRAAMSFFCGISRNERSRTTDLDTLAPPPGRLLLSWWKSDFNTCQKTVNWIVSIIYLSVPIHISLGLERLFLPQV